MRGIVCLFVAWGICAGSGCGSGRPQTVEVKGTVTYKGEPLPEASIMFFGDKGSPPATGQTDADGAFRLTTFEPNDGAIPGEYTVTIAKLESAEPATDDSGKAMPKESSQRPKSLIPQKYGDPKESELKETVTPGVPNEFAFELQE